ncbi:MAG TPA: hypothetical protein PKC18_17030 [Lacipirellulaceae bacterium]|nr:hypothetical protein [Lacipirellulaceae bacterium]HMP08313.1 hypothetical protein [Lacipirellulaceae bacterium]
MTSIVLTEEQAEVLKQSPQGVEIRGPKGEWLGVVNNHGWTDENVRVAKERLASPGSRHSTAEVLDYLRSLDAQ